MTEHVQCPQRDGGGVLGQDSGVSGSSPRSVSIQLCVLWEMASLSGPPSPK